MTDIDSAKKHAKSGLLELSELEKNIESNESSGEGVEIVVDGEWSAEWRCPQNIKDSVNDVRVRLNKILEALGQ